MAARAAVAALSLAFAAACGTAPALAPSSGGPAQNVTGTIDRGLSPTCPADEPCDAPPVARLLVFSAPGRQEVTTRVRPDGSFALHLDPGDYSIAAAPPAFQGKVQPSSIRVPEAGSVTVHLHIVKSA